MERSTDILYKCLEKIANDPISNLRVGSIETPGNKLVRTYPRDQQDIS